MQAHLMGVMYADPISLPGPPPALLARPLLRRERPLPPPTADIWPASLPLTLRAARGLGNAGMVLVAAVAVVVVVAAPARGDVGLSTPAGPVLI